MIPAPAAPLVERPPWLKLILWALVLAAALWILSRLHYTLTVFALAAILTYILNPVVRRLTSRPVPFTAWRLPRWSAVTLVFLVLVFLLVAAVILIAPAVTEQVTNLVSSIPQQSAHLRDLVSQWLENVRRMKLPPQVESRIGPMLDQGLSSAGAMVANIVGKLSILVLSALSGVVIFLTALVISLFILLRVDVMRNRFYTAVPEGWQADVRELFQEIHDMFGGFLRGMLIASVLTGILTYVGFHLWGFWLPPEAQFQYIMLVSVLNAVTYPIPILGQLIACGVAVSLALMTQPTWNYVFITFAIVLGSVKLVDTFVVPKILSDQMSVSPLFIIFAAFAGGELMGVWGMVLGVPMAALLKVLFRFIHRRFLASNTPGENPLPSA